MDAPGFQKLADIAVDVVQPERNGFTLTGQGADRAEYRLGVHFTCRWMPAHGRCWASYWRNPS